MQAPPPHLIRWVAEVAVNTLRTGTQAEAGGRVLEVLLARIAGQFNASRGAICRLSIGRFTFTYAPSSSCTNRCHPGFVNSTAFVAAAHALDPSTRLGGTNDVASSDTTFHDISSFGSKRREDPAYGASFGCQEPARVLWVCWEGRHRRTQWDQRGLGGSDAGVQLVG